MDVQTLTFIIVGLSFALYIGIAIWARAGSTNEFYVAGGGVPPLANGMATAADWMSAASFISMAGIISFAGYDGGVYLMGWTGGYVLLALCLAPYLRKFGKFTVPDFIGDRYYSQAARVVAILCAIFICFTYIAGQMRGVGVVFSRFLEVDIETGVYIGMVIVFFYAVLGGMKGITYTQVAQYCVLVFAYLVPAIFISMMMTGHFFPQTGFGATLSDGSGQFVLDKLDGLSTELGFAQYTEGSKSMIDVFAITGALMVGTAGLPHVIVRFFTVPRVKDTRISAAWTLVFIAIVYTTAPAVASFARVNMIDTINGKDGSGTEYAEAPAWVKNWERTGLITFNDKNGDGKMFYSAGKIDDPNSANEVKVDRDIMVLANPEIADLPAWVIALVAAGGIAAALSTTAGLLLVISTSLITLTGVAFFASWSLLTNITAYFLLLFQMSFRRGNFIRVLDADNYVEGFITEINLFNTKLITEDREIIVYPNNLILTRPSIINPRAKWKTVGKFTDRPEKKTPQIRKK